MNRDEKIKQALKGFNKIKESILIGDVVSVDETTATCVVDINGLEIEDIRLRSIESDDKGVFVVPKVGSVVIIARLLSSDDFCVIQAEELSKIKVKIGSRTLVIDEDYVKFDDGTNGGLTKTQELKTQLDKLTARVDAVYDAISNSPTLAQDGGATYKAAMASALALIIDKESFNNIENTDIQH